MSTVPLATAVVPTLADSVEEALAAALAGRDTACLWCGGNGFALTADIWSGAVTVACSACGSEFTGTKSPWPGAAAGGCAKADRLAAATSVMSTNANRVFFIVTASLIGPQPVYSSSAR